MKTSKKTEHKSPKNRKGVVAIITALLLVAILGMVACALDIGYMEMTRTQLQSVADASSLAGGTELMPGLGHFKTKTPGEVADAARPVASEFAGYNRNAELDSSYIDEDRDVEFGKATFDADGCNCWEKTPASEGAEYYNYIEVSPLRNQTGSGDGDGPAPLFFARILGMNEKSLQATATAAILPVNGFRVNEGSDDNANVMPFAFKQEYWERFERAQQYLTDHPNVFSDYPNWNTGPAASRLSSIKDTAGPYPTEPLFGALDNSSNMVQLFYDGYTRTQSDGGVNAGTVSSGGDGILEVNIYPRNLKHAGEPVSGNFGTVDFGTASNSTAELDRQIREGLNADDLSHYENNEIVLTEEDPLDTGGDTGVSGGIKDALESVIGECKAIALYSQTVGPGNNAVFTLVKFVSNTTVYVKLTGSPAQRELRMQPCVLVDDNGVPDTENEIGENTTIFTPLILIR
jgi:hypothetical protein